MDKLKTWKSSEPVRLYLYAVMVPVLAALAAKGVIGNDDVLLYSTIGGAVLLGPAIEKVRGAVYSPDTVDATMEVVEPQSDEEYVGDHRA